MGDDEMKIIPVPTVFGPNGAANVRLTKATVSVVFAESGEQYMFQRDTLDLPEYVKSGQWFVSVSHDGTKIYDIRPVAGLFPLLFAGFKKGQDGVPAPIPVKRDPDEDPKVRYKQHYLKCTSYFEVADGPFKGAKYPYGLRYLNLLNQSGFGSANGSLVIQGNLSKSIHVAKLAGLPPRAIRRAEEMLKELEAKRPKDEQLSLFAPKIPPQIKELQELNLQELTPIEALQKLATWQSQLYEI